MCFKNSLNKEQTFFLTSFKTIDFFAPSPWISNGLSLIEPHIHTNTHTLNCCRRLWGLNLMGKISLFPVVVSYKFPKGRKCWQV